MLRIAMFAAALGLAASAGALPALAGPTSVSLGRNLPELKLDSVNLGDAIDFLRDVSAANIVVDWKALESVGITRETPTNMRLRSVTLRKALNMLLADAAGGDQIGWMVDQGVIEITTKEIINSRLYTRVFDIQDLIMDIPSFDNAPDFSLQNKGQSKGGSSESLFKTKTDDKEKSLTKEERADQLVTLIRETVSPDIWVEAGGKATIRYFNGHIVVSAPKYVLEAIGGGWD